MHDVKPARAEAEIASLDVDDHLVSDLSWTVQADIDHGGTRLADLLGDIRAPCAGLLPLGGPAETPVAPSVRTTSNCCSGPSTGWASNTLARRSFNMIAGSYRAASVD